LKKRHCGGAHHGDGEGSFGVQIIKDNGGTVIAQDRPAPENFRCRKLPSRPAMWIIFCRWTGLHHVDRLGVDRQSIKEWSTDGQK